MVLRIKPADPQTIAAVKQFNQRMEAGRSSWKFYEETTSSWLPPADGATVWREHFILQDDMDGLVRGGYVLKHETFLLDGEEVVVAHQQGPVAESVIEPSLRGLGFRMVSDSLARRPLQTGWGATIRKGWEADTRPALIHVVNKGAFLRRASALRRNANLARVADFIALVGVGQVALAVAQISVATAAGGPGQKAHVEAILEDSFGDWADEVWSAVKSRYRLVAVRDAATLNRLMPPGAWPDAKPLKVSVGGRVVGWAALRDHHLSGDPQFGDLHAGSVVDALAVPGFEQLVAAAATDHLVARGVDFIGTIFSHKTWIEAFKRTRYIPVPGRRGIGFSPELVKAGGSLQSLLEGTHLTLIDADGPRIF